MSMIGLRSVTPLVTSLFRSPGVATSRQFLSHPLLPFRVTSMSTGAGLQGDQSLVAVVQLNCKSNKDDNFAIASKMVTDAAGIGCKMAFLPECFDMVCLDRKETLSLMEPIDGPLINRYRSLASDLKIWLSLGGFHEKVDGLEKARNSHIIINSEGDIVDVYNKVHLFNLDIPGVVRLVESDFSVAGDKILVPTKTPVGNVGLGICYDVRFPEMAISLAQSGADILTYPSAFTVTTGMDHWSTLLRARAIETQCYVVAAAQTGVHNPKRSSYGHAMIVDPWGAVIAQCSEGNNMAIGIIDRKVINSARSKLPIWSDRRHDIYGRLLTPNKKAVDIDSQQEYDFGQVKLPNHQVFIKTSLTFGFVNHRPVLPGHVLVAPLRSSVKRMKDLTPEETTDLFQVVQSVQSVMESMEGTDSTTIAIQDGVHAGQSVDHLHVHIIPRKEGDFNGVVDMIYVALQGHDKGPAKPTKTKEEMETEATILREKF